MRFLAEEGLDWSWAPLFLLADWDPWPGGDDSTAGGSTCSLHTHRQETKHESISYLHIYESG